LQNVQNFGSQSIIIIIIIIIIKQLVTQHMSVKNKLMNRSCIVVVLVTEQ